MRAGQPERIAKVREWAAFADDDLEFARAGLELGRRAKPRLIAYHAQQCAEKYLKCFLIFHAVDFPFTHHIGRLLDICATLGIWPARLEQTRVLTDFAISSRYPGEAQAVTRRDARNAVRLAESVRETVREELRKEGLKLISGAR